MLLRSASAIQLPLLLSLSMVASLGCGTEHPATETEASSLQSGATFESGHQRMLSALRDIQARTDVENLWQGKGIAEDARRDLEALSPSAPTKVRWEKLKESAYHELRLGNEVRAIELWQQAYDLLPVLAGEITEDEANRTIFRLAVAHLRHGETLNCARRHSPESCILPIRGDGIHADQQGSRAAIRYLEEVLERTARNDLVSAKSIWLLNIAYMTIGGFPSEVPDSYRVPAAIFGSSEPFPRFENIAGALGLDTYNLFGGMIVDDFTGDGRLDVITSTFDTSGQMRFFRNRAGTFEEQTAEVGLEGLFGGLNLVQADYDNDGDLDLLVLRGAWLSVAGRHPNSLLRNDGLDAQQRLTFTDVTYEAGLADVSYPTQTASWADYDGDGDLDLYIGNEHGGRHFDGPCQLFRNDGLDESGFVRFTDVAGEAGVDNRSFVKGVIWGDYDNDDRPDLYVSTLGGPNRLYHNDGPGADGRVTFTDVAREAGVDGPQDSFPVWFFDYDNDGNLDLYVPSYRGDLDGVGVVAASYFGAKIPWENPRLYKGDGNGGFRDVALEQGLERFHLPMGANFGDIDNDGFLDFYLGTGYPDYEALMPNVLYRNLGGSGFVDVTLAAGMGHLQKGHAISFADFDHDGDQDVFVQMGGAFPGDRFNDALFENPGFENHWITIQLVGERSNRSAIGARIRAVIIEDGVERSVYRHVNSGGSFGCNPLRQSLGLGKATSIRKLEIYWPTTDHTQVFDDLPVDQMIRIFEDRDQYERVTVKKLQL